MAKIRSEKIESAAVSCITDAFFKSTRLSPFIPVGDKERVWDGNIYILHGNKSISRIPAQVKGKTIKKLPKRPTYPISVTNLHNYKRDGGVIYFVVYIVEGIRYPYFKLLAPIDLKRYIKQAKGKRSISVNLDPFGPVEPDLENQIIQFFYDCKKQTSFVDAKPLSLEEAIKKGYSLNYSIHGASSEEEAFKYLTTHYSYLYANIGDKENSVLYPIGDQPFKLFLLQHIHKPVTCGGRICFDLYQDGCNGIRREIAIGNFLRLTKDADSCRSKLDLNFSLDNLQELANQLDFALALSKEKKFFIGEECVDLNGIDKKFQKEIQSNFRYWDDIIKTFRQLNCDLSKINVSSFNDKDFGNLRLLKRIIIDKEEVAQDKDVSGVTTMQIGPYKVLLFAEKCSNGRYKIIDFFKLREKHVFAGEGHNGEKFAVSIFSAVLQREDTDCIINLDFENFITSYEEAAVFNRHITDQANQDVLAMISAYDRLRKKDNRFLEYAIKLTDWIIEHSEKDTEVWYVYELNKFQIIKRMNGKFTNEEKEHLLELADDNIPAKAKWAANILLEDYSRSDRLWRIMDEKDKEELRIYPIYWFEKNRKDSSDRKNP